MRDAYISICEKLDEDIRAACEFTPGDDIQFGPRSTPHEDYPNATVVLQPLPRVSGGARSIDEKFSIAIEIQLPKAKAKERDAELLKIEFAERLVQRLVPYLTTDALPVPFPSVPPYAGVGWRPWVESFDPGHDSDSKGGWCFKLHFTCTVTVHQ